MASIRNFGATGDGQMDDTDAIQHALDDGDGAIELPRGNYRITRPLVVDLTKHGRRSINGMGGVAKLQMFGPGPAIILSASHSTTADPKGFRPEEWENERMPTVSGIEIEGHHEKADGIQIVGVAKATLTGVLIREVNTGIHVTKRARNLIFNHCHVYHNRGVGVHFEALNLHQVNINGCHISYNRLGGIRIEDSEIRNLQITGNDIEYNNAKSHPGFADEPTAEIYIDVRQQSVREVTIASNTIQATPSKGGCSIRLLGHSADVADQVGLLTISGNLIGNQENNIHITSSRDVTISGNEIYGAHDRIIRVEKSSNIVVSGNGLGHNAAFKDPDMRSGVTFEDCEDCTVSALLIQNCRAVNGSKKLPTETHPKGLIELIRCRRMNLTGNQILLSDPYGLYIEDCEDTLVTGCTVLDHRSPKQMKAAVYWKGTGTGNMIASCRLGKGTEQTIISEGPLIVGENCYDPE